MTWQNGNTDLIQSSIQNPFSSPQMAPCVVTDGQEIRAALVDAS